MKNNRCQIGARRNVLNFLVRMPDFGEPLFHLL